MFCPMPKAMHQAILNNRDLYGLPRKFNISFDNGGQYPFVPIPMI